MKRCGLTLVFLFLATLTWGQTATGVAPFSSQKAGSFDSVNLGNLNVHFEVPIVNKAGRGLPFRYALVYDSSIWVPKTVSGTMTWQPINQWWGWSANTQAAVGYVTQRVTQRKCIPSGSGPSWYFYSVYTYTSYVDRSGVQHPFNLVLDDDSFGDCGTGRESGTATTTDGSGLKLSAIMGTNSATITTPEGTMITAPVQINGAGTVRDDNGNKITTTGNVFTDTIGTSALTISGTNPVLYSYLNPAGTSSAVKLNYASKAVRTNFGCNGIGQPETVAEFGPTTVSMVSSIELPDGSKYVINYEPTPGYSGYVTGRISSITLPTGGQISYSYPSPNGGIRCSDGSTAKLTRTETPGGTWVYSRALVSGTTWETTIYDPPTDEHPNGNKTTVTFQKATTPGSTSTTFLETKRVVNTGTSTVLQTVDTCYNINALSQCQLPPSFPIASVTVTTRLPDASGKTSERYTKFTSLGLPYEMGEYDFGNGARGNLLRKTAITYDATLANGIYDRPSNIQVYDGSNTLKAQTNYTYDEGTPEPTSALQHDPISGSRGNATTVSRWVSGSNWLTQQFAYFDTGLIYTSKENGRDETKFTYTYGECENAFPTYIAVPMNLHRSAHWDCRGGVLLWSKDENDQQTSYTYDNLWRPDSKTDPLGNVTDFYYQPDAAHPTPEVAWFLNFNGGSSVASDIQYKDGFGRTYSHQRSQGPNASMLDTVSYGYDANGRLKTTSLPCSVTWEATCPDIAVTRTYDALDRPLQALDKGGGTATYTYQGNDVLVAIGPAPSGENEKKKQLEYDALGRLTSVCELTSAANGGGNCAQSTPAIGYWTKYTYDVLGNLTGVSQNAQSGSPQTRTYFYDALGRMTSEQNPESLRVPTQYVYDSDTSGVTPTCSGTYKGDLVKRIDPAGNTTCYAYDALHRVTAITYPGGPNAPSTSEKHFVYDDSSVTYNGGPAVMQKTKGRLARAYTGPEGSKVTDLLYNYNERGEVVDVYQFTPHSGGYHKVTGDYWANGVPKTQSQIKFATSAPTGEVTVAGLPAITYGVDGEGRISTINGGGVGLATTVFSPDANVSVPSGFLTKVTYGSGDTDSFTPDGNTGGLKEYKFSINNQDVIGTLTWNPNGSLASLAITDPFNTANSQTCNYQHDDLLRIKSVDCGTSWYQSFTFDPFGNINKTTRPESTGQSFLHQYSTATNRITDFPANAYDSNGNLTNDGVYSFEWDAEGKMRSVTSGSTVTATYDALGRMVEQARGTSYTQILYGVGGEKLALLNGNTLAQAFIALPGGGTAVYTSSGLSRYRHADWLGSSRFASTPTSPTTKVYSGAYAPYGESYAESGTTDRSFTGQNQDTTTGLYDFIFREYNPVHGRWISPDPLGMAAADPTNPQSWNLYAYVGNSPLDMVDPLGMRGANREGDDGGICPAEYSAWECWPWFPPFPIPIGGGGGSIGGGWPSPRPPSPGAPPNRPIGGSWPNGESLGIPTGMGLPQLSLCQTLGLCPIGPACDFGNVCVPLGSGYATGVSGSGTAGSPFTISVYVWAGMHLCGDWMCDEHGNLVSRAPQEIRGLSEDVSVEFAIAGIAGKGAQAGRFLFDPHWWSSGRFLRIGFGRKGGIRVFRLAGNWPRHWHWDIWKGGRL